VVALLQIRALISGPQEYAETQKWLASPFILTLNAISFVFLIFHTVTWFNLAPKAMVIRLRGQRLPAVAVAAPNYAIWVLLSAAIAWILLRG
jgi:fumarate reductase subunit C